jgi:EAL domain-containing protein (putative c-di-GMP-specific phosphodiesterase class I)
MNAIIIAEGIETEEELNVLKQLGTQLGQGYFFAEPGGAFPDINR